jgi:hypothetical protein
MTSQFDLLKKLLIKRGLSVHFVWVSGQLPCNVNVRTQLRKCKMQKLIPGFCRHTYTQPHTYTTAHTLATTHARTHSLSLSLSHLLSHTHKHRQETAKLFSIFFSLQSATYLVWCNAMQSGIKVTTFCTYHFLEDRRWKQQIFFLCTSMLSVYKTTRCHMPKDHILDTHCLENAKFYPR